VYDYIMQVHVQAAAEVSIPSVLAQDHEGSAQMFLEKSDLSWLVLTTATKNLDF